MHDKITHFESLTEQNRKTSFCEYLQTLLYTSSKIDTSLIIQCYN